MPGHNSGVLCSALSRTELLATLGSLPTRGGRCSRSALRGGLGLGRLVAGCLEISKPIRLAFFLPATCGRWVEALAGLLALLDATALLSLSPPSGLPELPEDNWGLPDDKDSLKKG